MLKLYTHFLLDNVFKGKPEGLRPFLATKSRLEMMKKNGAKFQQRILNSRVVELVKVPKFLDKIPGLSKTTYLCLNLGIWCCVIKLVLLNAIFMLTKRATLRKRSKCPKFVVATKKFVGDWALAILCRAYFKIRLFKY